MINVDLRRHQRILVPAGYIMPVHSNGSAPSFEGVVTVIGLGGMFIRTSKARPPGTVLKLTLKNSLITFESECTVRHVAKNGIGVEITQITPENEQRLRSLLLQFKA
jgi:PilZ domain